MWGIFNIEQTRQEAAKLVQVQSTCGKTFDFSRISKIMSLHLINT